MIREFAKFVNVLGLTSQKKKDLEKASYYFNNSLIKTILLDDHKAACHIKTNLARVYLNLGQYNKASILLKEIMKFFANKKNISYYLALNNLIIVDLVSHKRENFLINVQELRDGLTNIELTTQSSIIFLATAKYLIELDDIDEATEVVAKISPYILDSTLLSIKANLTKLQKL